MIKIISCLFSLSPQSNWHHVEAPEPEHYPGAAAELRGLSDAGGADRPAGDSLFSLLRVWSWPTLVSEELTPSPQPAHPCCWVSPIISVLRWSFQTRRDRDVILISFLLLATTPQTGRSIKEKRFGLAPGSGPSSGQRLVMTSFLAESPGGRRHHMATDKSTHYF